LVKLLVDEPGSDTAREIYGKTSLKSASALGYVETISALTRGRNDGRFSVARFEGAIDELEAIWSEIDIHAVTTEVIQEAARVVIDRGLRAYDSLHLATALALARIENVIFVCWDHELREAAGSCGLALEPEQA
jgi:predicted nucleic acid-binding protein